MTTAMMRMSDILLLYQARLRARAVLVQEGLAVMGIAIGVALLFASQVASTSLTHSVQQLTSQVFGSTQQFQLDARGPAGVYGGLEEEVRRLPGVRTALPVLEVQANVVGPTGQRSVDLLGTSPSFARSDGPLLRHSPDALLEKVRAIALPAPLARAIGAGALERVQLQIGASVVHTLIGATLQEADIGGLMHSPIAVASVAYVQRMAGMGDRITRIFVEPMRGHDTQVRAALSKLAGRAGMNLEPGRGHRE
jgi:putative ABC transport system permease protein